MTGSMDRERDEDMHGRGRMSMGVEGQLSRLDERTATISRSLDNIVDKLDKLDSKYVGKEEFENLKKDFRDLKGNIIWAVKIVMGAVIVAVLGLVIVKAKTGGL